MKDDDKADDLRKNNAKKGDNNPTEKSKCGCFIF